MVQEMRQDKEVFLIGEDIGTYGGAFGVSKGMLEEFGPERIRDTPISEAAIAGAATGAALMGMRPVMEVMFMDFLTISMNQLVNAGGQDALHVRRQVQHPNGDPRPIRLGHRRRCTAFAEHWKPGL